MPYTTSQLMQLVQQAVGREKAMLDGHATATIYPDPATFLSPQELSYYNQLLPQVRQSMGVSYPTPVGGGTKTPPPAAPPGTSGPTGPNASWAYWESVPHPPGTVNPYPRPGSLATSVTLSPLPSTPPNDFPRPPVPPGSGPRIRPVPIGTYGNDNIAKTMPPRSGGGMPTYGDLPQNEMMHNWNLYSQQRYKPGMNIMQMRNEFLSRPNPPQQALYGGPEGPQKIPGTGMTGYAEGGTAALSPGAALQNIRMGLTPATYNSMTPSYRDFLAGVVSSLGMPPEDFFQQQEQSFPTGVNPNQNIAAGFRSGGKVKFKRNADGSMEFHHE